MIHTLRTFSLLIQYPFHVSFKYAVFEYILLGKMTLVNDSHYYVKIYILTGEKTIQVKFLKIGLNR